ncbi:unnamed protein product [Parnassius apollo]|uniref:(apollo) hypothetical protein n=1 Tax=Parnassius apollo TaxID=110799 RepID=A0A8S3Y6V2_PARAO|nr:unnamed protein product [Parnassius apollo]
MSKGGLKAQLDHVWIDDQIQPLPRSVRKRLHGWARAEDLAQSQWEADVFVFEDNNGGKMSTADMQFAHHQVFQMSSFCRRVLSMCYILERAEGFTALLKLAAPDMNSDDDSDYVEDEPMEDMDIMHALTGSLNVKYYIEDADELWKLITSEVQLFTWNEDHETYSSTVKSKTKRPGTKENSRRSLTTILIEDSRNMPPFTIPEITPAFEMHLLVVMARDFPLKKPLPEPEVAPWKHHRWIDWARKHGMYEAFDCPRTRFLKLNGLLKLSLAPHLLDVQSTESVRKIKKAVKDKNPSVTTNQSEISRLKEELREWVQFDAIQKLMKSISTLCFPSMYQFCSIASNPPIRITKLSPKKELDIPPPKNAPLYLQIDAPEEIYLKISCSMLHPRVFLNANQPIDDYVEPGYVLVEVFQWFTDCELPKSKAYLQTRGYDAMEVSFKPGRHFCRLWIHSRVPWYVMLLSESTIHVGTRDVIQMAAIRECSWASRFLTNLGAAFQKFIRANKSTTFLSSAGREFYRSYKPDLDWNSKEVGFSKSHVHWMFRQALQSTLEKKLAPFEYRSVCAILQNYFNDPDFGLSKKRLSSMSPKNLCINDLCNCPVSEAEELEVYRIHYNDTDIDNKSFDEYTKNKLQPSVCDAASVKLPYGVLKSIRDEIIKRHEAATCIQAHWRGIRTRRCLDSRVTLTLEITKYHLNESVLSSFRSHRKYGKPASAGIKVRSSIKVKDQRLSQDAKTYFIELRAPKGWPLTLAQWKRVIAIQNYQEFKTEVASKKSLREKVSSAKDKEKTEPPICQQPQPGDAYVQLECSLSADTGVFAKRDDTRDLQFAAELKSWEASEPGRNVKGAQYRKEFREEFLENTTALFVENTDAKSCEILENAVSEEFTKNRHIQGPTPATESEVSEACVDFKNEDKYLTMPQELQDKFKPLDFIPLCTRERNDEDRVIITPEMLEDYKKSRQARIEEAMERVNQLQIYNDVHILEAQKVRCDRLEKLFVDSQWSPGLIEALEARDNTVADENTDDEEIASIAGSVPLADLSIPLLDVDKKAESSTSSTTDFSATSRRARIEDDIQPGEAV